MCLERKVGRQLVASLEPCGSPQPLSRISETQKGNFGGLVWCFNLWCRMLGDADLVRLLPLLPLLPLFHPAEAGLLGGPLHHLCPDQCLCLSDIQVRGTVWEIKTLLGICKTVSKALSLYICGTKSNFFLVS